MTIYILTKEYDYDDGGTQIKGIVSDIEVAKEWEKEGEYNSFQTWELDTLPERGEIAVKQNNDDPFIKYMDLLTLHGLYRNTTLDSFNKPVSIPPSSGKNITLFRYKTDNVTKENKEEPIKLQEGIVNAWWG